MLYNGAATIPTAAGTYAVTANFVPTDTTNFTSLTAASAGNFIIQQATPTLSVTNSPVTYNGSAQAATIIGSVPGAVSNVKYNGSATIPTAAGTYTITADFAPTDTTNFTSLTAVSAGNFIIQPATPTLAVTNSPVTYNGSPQPAIVTGSIPGAVSNVLYNSAATIPTAAGTYAVTADFAPTDTTNFTSLTAVSAGNLTVQPLALILGGGRPYDGTTSAAAAVLTVSNNIDGANLTLSGGVTLDGKDAGPQAITSFAGLSLGGTAAGNYTITGASGSVTITADPRVVWQKTYFTPDEIQAGLAADNVDADGDGATNLVEYAFNGNPRSATSSGLFDTRMVAGKLTFTCAVRRGAVFAADPTSHAQVSQPIEGMTYAIQGSRTLTGEWNSEITAGEVSNTAPAGSYLPVLTSGWQYHTFSGFNTQSDRGFLRAVITKP